MHKRLTPAVNQFTYGVYYLAIPLHAMNELELGGVAYNRPGWHAFYDRDHGARDGTDLQKWARAILQEHAIDRADGDIVLITFPRVLGYVFNPVSFWLCYDRQSELRAVLYEVNNTFSESHTYLCAHPDQRVIRPDDIITGQKLFHVSPFLERSGRYRFRLTASRDRFGVWIDWEDEAGSLCLATALTGVFMPMTSTGLRALAQRHPLVTLKAILLIHWQALKLIWKRVRYIAKPRAYAKKVSITLPADRE